MNAKYNLKDAIQMNKVNAEYSIMDLLNKNNNKFHALIFQFLFLF